MNKIKDLIKQYANETYRYTIKNKVTTVATDQGSFVFKPNQHHNDLNNLFKYLGSRNFKHFPPLIDQNSNYNVFSYVEEVATPQEQKAHDLIYLISLLHNKTTYYEEMDQDEYKAIYEDLIIKLDYLTNYYNELIVKIESNVYMSPSEYLVARNISKINETLNYCRRETEAWYEIIKTKTKKRVVTLHHNLETDHLLVADDLYLISWDYAKIGFPIYDLVIFYKKDGLNYDFSSLLKLYESKYPLFPEERKLLFILLALPTTIEFKGSELDNCKQIEKEIAYLYKTEQLLKPYYPVQEIEQTT